MTCDKGGVSGDSRQDWLDAFAESLAGGDPASVAMRFTEDGIWRDYVAVHWSLTSSEGRAGISGFVRAIPAGRAFRNPVFESGSGDREGFFRFDTDLGRGRGHIRLHGDGCAALFTMLESLADAGAGRSPSPRIEKSDSPFVVIAGGGQGGLALGAQLSEMGVPYLIVDRHPRIGDQWRSRYASLVLHDPVWYDHLPFAPFPEDWPVFATKDQMGDWLEAYARKLALNVWTGAELTGAAYDTAEERWTVKVMRDDGPRELRPSHLVIALGVSGFPRVPDFEGRRLFRGRQLHSSSYEGGREFSGRNVIVVGANNSAHDIASDLVDHGAKPLMIQRSSTLVVRQEDYCERILGPLYSREAVARGLTTDKADILTAATPIRHLEREHRALWDRIRSDRAGYYDRLEGAGFTLDFAEDGAGLGLKYRRTASGYYIDVGAAEMVADGRIALRSGVSISRLDPKGVVLDTGEHLPADAVVYATGFGTMTDWVEALVGPETAEKVGPCWGYGSGFKGDPGPWIGELRNMWLPTAQPGLWFMGGNLAQARFYSRRLALQLQARYLGLAP